MSPVEQDTIDCEYLAYFEPKRNPEKLETRYYAGKLIGPLLDFPVHIMQLLSANAAIFFF